MKHATKVKRSIKQNNDYVDTVLINYELKSKRAVTKARDAARIATVTGRNRFLKGSGENPTTDSKFKGKIVDFYTFSKIIIDSLAINGVNVTSEATHRSPDYLAKVKTAGLILPENVKSDIAVSNKTEPVGIAYALLLGKFSKICKLNNEQISEVHRRLKPSMFSSGYHEFKEKFYNVLGDMLGGINTQSV